MADADGTQCMWSWLFPDSRELVRSFLTGEELIPLRVTCRAEWSLRSPTQGSYWQWTEKHRRDIHLALALGLTPRPLVDDNKSEIAPPPPAGGGAWCYRFTCVPIAPVVWITPGQEKEVIEALPWRQVVSYFQRRLREEKISSSTPTIAPAETWLRPYLVTDNNFRISVTEKRVDLFEWLPVKR